MSIAADLDTAIALLIGVRASLAPALPYTALTDRLPRAKPPVITPGPAGSIATDPTFGRRILRVTAGLDSNTCPSNAHHAAWSADGSHFYVSSAGGTPMVHSFDPATLSATYLTHPYSQTEPTFSRTDPSLLYVVGGPIARTLQSYNITTHALIDILDLDSQFSDLAEPRTYVGGLGNSPTKLIAYFGGQGQDSHDRLIVIDLATGAQTLLHTVDRCGFYLHAASIDLSGRFVLLYPTGGQPHQVYVWDLLTDTIAPVINAPYGHDALSYGKWVNMDSSGAQGWDAAQWQLRDLTDLTSNHDLINPVLLPKEVYLADHTTWNNASALAALPAISSTYRVGTEATPWRAWDDEIIGISTNGSGLVYRFCHHRSDANEGFWSQPIANVSPDGRHCLFTSNWDRTLGHDPAGAIRQDVFLVEL